MTCGDFGADHTGGFLWWFEFDFKVFGFRNESVKLKNASCPPPNNTFCNCNHFREVVTWTQCALHATESDYATVYSRKNLRIFLKWPRVFNVFYRVPRIENRAPRIRENYHRVPRIIENRVPTGPYRVRNSFLKKKLKWPNKIEKNWSLKKMTAKNWVRSPFKMKQNSK